MPSPPFDRSRTAGAAVLALAISLLLSPAAHAQSPDEIEAVRSAIQAGRLAEAIAGAEALVSGYPGTAAPLIWLGHAYRLAGQSTEATRAYLRAREIVPDDPEMLMGLGEIQESTGNYVEAAASYARVMAVAPDAAVPYRRAGAVQIRLGNHATAAEYLAAYVERVPDDLSGAHLLGVAQYLSQDHDAAIASFDSVLARDPDHLPAAYGLGVVLAERPDEFERALELLRLAAERHYEEVDARYLIGRILSDQGDFDGAVPELERSLQLDPDQLDANYRLAQAWSRLGDRETARRYSERFRVLQQQFNEREAADKELRTLRNALVQALGDADLEQADELLHQMLAAAPDDPETLIQAAKVWMSTNDDVAATDAVVAALQLQPAHWEGLYLRGLLLARAGNPQAALGALQLSLEQNALFADTHAAIGNALLQIDATGEAIDAYLAAIDLDPDNPGYHLNLAAAYGRQGRPDLERQAMDRYRELLRNQSVPQQ